MKLTHVIESKQFEPEWLVKDLFPLVDQMKEMAMRHEGRGLHVGDLMVSFFVEASTRTRLSFEIAMMKMGGNVVSSEHAGVSSSVVKKESIEHTMRVISSYLPDVIVLRSTEEGMAERAAKSSSVPVINAGDGKGQHPTQTLLDLYTIWKELGRIEGLSIALVGDLLNGRTVHSLAYVLAKFGVKIYLVSPEPLRMKPGVLEYLSEHSIEFTEERELRKVADKVNIIYQTRVQEERGSVVTKEEELLCAIDRKILNMMDPKAIIMHPMPCNKEISPDFDDEPQVVFFRQAQNGLFVRMALLDMILGEGK